MQGVDFRQQAAAMNNSGWRGCIQTSRQCWCSREHRGPLWCLGSNEQRMLGGSSTRSWSNHAIRAKRGTALLAAVLLGRFTMLGTFGVEG